MSIEKSAKLDALNRYASLIQKQTGRIVRPYRADGYVNLMNKYGTQKDVSERYRYQAEPPVPDDLLTMFYEGNGLFAKIIDTPAEEAVKNGFTMKGLKDQDLEEFYNDALDDLDWEENMITAIKWARLFGGSIVVMMIDDGGGLEEPLDWRNIRSIDDMRVYDRSLIQPDWKSLYNYKPNDPFGTRGSRLGLPEFYDVYSKYGTFRVHDSRCLVFQNGILPENTSNSIYEMWGMPEYVRLKRAIRDAEISHGAAPKLLDRSVQAIYKMKDLSAELATEEGEDRVLKRLQIIDMARGLLNSIAIDSEGEEYDFRTFQFNGVADVIDSACNFLSALTCIPQTILFGRSPAGMNSTGESDLENWYNYLERIQKRMLKGNLRYLLSIIFQAGYVSGQIDEAPPIKIDFNPLWSLSEQEEAALEQTKASTQQTKAQTAQIYVDMQAIDPTEVRKKLADSEEFDVENMLDEFDDEQLFPEDQLEMHAPTGQAGGEQGAMPGAEGAMPGEAPEQQAPQQPAPEAQAPVQAQPVEEKKKETDAQDTLSNSPKRPEIMDKDKRATFYTDGAKHDSVGVYVIKNGKILTGTRMSGDGSYLICGPGGHVEKGETAGQAAIRETQEEFGITPLELIPIGKGAKESNGLQPDLFLCVRYEGEPKCESDEMGHPVFRSIEELEGAGNLFDPFQNGLVVLLEKLSKNEYFKEKNIDFTPASATIKMEGNSKTNNDGGPGSGNWGHAGRPGEKGGSAAGNGPAKYATGDVSGAKKVGGYTRKNTFKNGYGTTKVNPKDRACKSGLSMRANTNGKGEWKEEREALHSKIIDDTFEGVEKADGQPVTTFMGGGPASGKSYVVKAEAENLQLPADNQRILIDPDKCKKPLPEYDPDNPGPVHEESSSLSKRMTQIAQENGYNVLVDGTGDGSADKMRAKIEQAKEAGHVVNGVYVFKPVEDAIVANFARERTVNPKMLVETHSKISTILPEIARDFDDVKLYANVRRGEPPILIATGGSGKDLTVLDQGLYDQFLANGNYQYDQARVNELKQLPEAQKKKQ